VHQGIHSYGRLYGEEHEGGPGREEYVIWPWPTLIPAWVLADPKVRQVLANLPLDDNGRPDLTKAKAGELEASMAFTRAPSEMEERSGLLAAVTGWAEAAANSDPRVCDLPNDHPKYCLAVEKATIQVLSRMAAGWVGLGREICQELLKERGHRPPKRLPYAAGLRSLQRKLEEFETEPDRQMFTAIRKALGAPPRSHANRLARMIWVQGVDPRLRWNSPERRKAVHRLEERA
jgi:hypothetical protein